MDDQGGSQNQNQGQGQGAGDTPSWRYSEMGPLGRKNAGADPQGSRADARQEEAPPQFQYPSMKDLPRPSEDIPPTGRYYPSMNEVEPYTAELIDMADRGDFTGYATRIKEQLQALGASPQECELVNYFQQHAVSGDPAWSKWGKDMAMWVRNARISKEKY
jgi:hypothetical protein